MNFYAVVVDDMGPRHAYVVRAASPAEAIMRVLLPIGHITNVQHISVFKLPELEPKGEQGAPL